MIVRWVERVMSTYQIAADKRVVFPGPGVCSSDAAAELCTTLNGSVQSELLVEDLVPLLEVLVLAAEVLVLLLV